MISAYCNLKAKSSLKQAKMIKVISKRPFRTLQFNQEPEKGTHHLHWWPILRAKINWTWTASYCAVLLQIICWSSMIQQAGCPAGCFDFPNVSMLRQSHICNDKSVGVIIGAPFAKLFSIPSFQTWQTCTVHQPSPAWSQFFTSYV